MKNQSEEMGALWSARETLGDLEPVYHQFTSAITLPQSVTHVDYAQNSTLKREETWETLKTPRSQEEELGPGQKCMKKPQKEAFRMKGAL